MSEGEIGGGPGPGLRRRTFLKISGAAVVAPAVGWPGRSPRTTALSGGKVVVGGALVRPPSVPLAVRSPYLSAWLPATGLTATTPQFWFGSSLGFAGMVRVDGHLYWWAGPPPAGGTAATQTSLQVTATRSVFTLTAGGVELTAEWLSPIEPGDLRRASVPLTLLTVTVQATDGSSHDVQLYADITGEWASSDETATITWKTTRTATSRYWSVRLKAQHPLTEFQQMARWGTVVWATPRSVKLTYQSGSASAVRSRFQASGSLGDTSDPHFRPIGDNQPVFAFARDLDTVTASQQTASFVIGHVRSPLLSYGKHATPLKPLWTRYWPDWTAMADFFLGDADAARGRAIALDAKIENSATAAAGTGYSAICALAARQCYGGVELAIGPHGQPWLMGKEISSDGDVNTVDIFSQAYLMWLWLDPQIIPRQMEPILDWCASPGWQDPSLWTNIPSWKHGRHRYCVHDLGVYPVAPVSQEGFAFHYQRMQAGHDDGPVPSAPSPPQPRRRIRPAGRFARYPRGDDTRIRQISA